MAFYSVEERTFLKALSELTYCNPFLPERISLERQALGPEFDATEELVWHKRSALDPERPNVDRLLHKAAALTEEIRGRLEAGGKASPADQLLYEDLVIYWLYYQYRKGLPGEDPAQEPKSRVASLWRTFRGQMEHFLAPCRHAVTVAPAHLFACYFQVRRAFYYTYHFIVGGSLAAAKLRSAIWQSVFTHDMRRYRRVLYRTMGDNTTLISGPTGTGKELVARAIGLSRYIPFDEKTEQFQANFSESFYALNLSALSPTLIESELFGHCRGAFTGAVGDRPGWLEVCPPLGTVFLDEIGELDQAIQVKLLRALQDRTFQRLGETTARRFEGKVIAATNRNLSAEMQLGTFRPDFYYRLCSDLISTPSLAEQLAESPDDLENLVRFLAGRVVGEPAADLAQEVLDWIRIQLPRDYPWPGNIRELEQCVRNVMIRRQYRPPVPAVADSDPYREIVRTLRAFTLSAPELTQCYCTLAFAEAGTYEGAGEKLRIDRRTVKKHIDLELLDRLRAILNDGGK